MFNKITTMAAVALLIFATAYISEADAKRGSSSRSTSSSKSYSFKSKPKPNSTTNKPYVASKKTTTSRTKVAKKTSTASNKTAPAYGANITTKQKVATSRAAYKQQQSAFKQKPLSANKTTTSTRTNYKTSTNPIITKTTHVNRTTYVNRRGSYYNNWNTPSYAYNSYSSFGIWDSMALWYMMDHLNEAKYREMYYHQRNTPGMQEWRAEANKLSADNAEMKAKLALMDTQVNIMKKQGIKVDPSYTPPGVDPDLLLSSEVLTDTKPVLNVCTGPTNKNYYHVAKILGADLESTNVNVIVTAGSAENLTNMENGKCDASIVQRDAYLTHVDNNPASPLAFTRIMSPYAEVAHIVCNRLSGIERISQLTNKHTIAIGENGSGSAVTWANIVAEGNYNEVKTLAIGGGMAQAKVTTGEADCILTVSGLNTKFMKDLSSVNTVKLDIIDFDDSTIFNAQGPDKEPVYSTYTLSSDTYANLQTDNWINYFNTSNTVITVQADIIVNNSWATANTTSFDGFVAETSNKLAAIRNYVGTN